MRELGERLQRRLKTHMLDVLQVESAEPVAIATNLRGSGMGSEGWRTVALQDVTDEITVGHVGPMASEYVTKGIPFLRSQNVDPLRINDDDLKFITPEFHERLGKSRLSPGDVVIVRTGRPGSCAVIPDSLPVANCSDLVIVRCAEDLDPQFFAYYVNSAASHHISAHLVGAVQQHFNVGSARQMEIVLPDVSKQRAIARILGTLDDKIELNRRMNETLEAIARAIFTSWFVDFDPVRARAEGRDTGLPPHIADLFPDSFEDSELGEIPSGWQIRTLGDVVEFAYGKALKDSSRNPGSVPVYGSNGRVGCHDESLVPGPGVVVGRKGNPGTVTWVPVDFFPIDTTFYVVPKLEFVGIRFLYFALGAQRLASLSADSAVPGLNRNLAYTNSQVVPRLKF